MMILLHRLFSDANQPAQSFPSIPWPGACDQPCSLMQRILGRRPKARHVWKVVKRETLGQYTHFGSRPQEMCTMHRIAEHVQCVRCGKVDVIEQASLHPAD